METAAASRVGAGMLSEIEETSLDEILASLRTSLATPATTNAPDVNVASSSHNNRPKDYPFAPLNDLVQRHFRATQSAPLAICGRHLPLLYALVATLVAPPHNKAVLVVDMDGRFDVTRILDCTTFPPQPASSTLAAAARPGRPQTLRPSDLNHVHVARPARGDRAHTASAVASAQHFMLYGTHSSRSREWWGTLVVGGGIDPAGQPSVDVTAGWKGWLRVDRNDAEEGEGDGGLGFGGRGVLSIEEARGAEPVRPEAEWVATSVWGGFGFGFGSGDGDGDSGRK